MTTVSGDGRQSEWGGIRPQSPPGHQPLPVTEHPSATVLPPAQLGGYLCPGLLLISQNRFTRHANFLDKELQKASR